MIDHVGLEAGRWENQRMFQVARRSVDDESESIRPPRAMTCSQALGEGPD